MDKGVYAIILAAGSGRRLGLGYNKMLLKLGDRTVLEHTLLAFSGAGCFTGVIIACRSGERRRVTEISRRYFDRPPIVVEGGKERQDSVWNALKALPPDAEIVAVHDGARCFVTPEIILDCVASARKHGSGVACRRAVDTVKEISGDNIEGTIDRRGIALAETPQTFRADILRKAYEKARADGYLGTDDASLVERLGIRPRMVESRKRNDKITHRIDVAFGEYLLGEGGRVGHGMDVHRLAANRRLVLGGVEIPWAKGLAGHSDADVLVHAVMDALLGAARLPDIGQLFPDDDASFEGADSIALLQNVGDMIRLKGFSVENIDATLILEQPKIASYRARMAENIANALEIEVSRVNVKATTTEGLGPEGRGEGVTAHAVCLLDRIRYGKDL